MEQRNWFIIESGTSLEGPFTFEEVKGRFSQLPKRSILICDGHEPIYSNDVERFNEIVEKGFGRWKSFASRSSVQGLAGDPFSDADHFRVCSSSDLRGFQERFIVDSSARRSGWVRRLWRRLFSRSRGPRKRRMFAVRKRHLALFALMAWGYNQIRPLEERVTLSWLRGLVGPVRLAARHLPVEVRSSEPGAVVSIWRQDSPVIHAIGEFLENSKNRAGGDGSTVPGEGE